MAHRNSQSKLPKVHRDTVLCMHRELDDTAFAELEAELLKPNGALWDEISRGAREISGDDLEMREKIMRYGAGLVEVLCRSLEIDSLEAAFAAPDTVEPSA